jgi:DUF4097 and DUF4098 domain-containing protein YvlB
MMGYRTFVIAGTVLALASPAAAAVTRSAGVEEHPRSPWFERYQESRQGPEQTERFTETYKVGTDTTVDLTHIAGDVHVVTGRTSEIRIEAVKRVRHRDIDQAKRYLSQLRIEVSQVGGRLEVRTIYPRSSSRGLSSSVDYTITVPATANVSVKTVSGNVSVAAVRGEVRAETVSGNVDVTSTPNLVLAKTVSGDVRAKDISATSLTLGTVSGSVIATSLKVRALDAGSVSGDVQLSNLQVERLTAKTISGEIDFDGSLARGGRYEFNAHSGGVRLVLANVPGFELDASTFSGSIRTDFPVTLRSTPGDDPRRRRGLNNRAIRGTFGDASAILSIRSFSGTVVITKK